MSILVATAVVPYLVPTWIGAYRDHPSKNAIFLTNLFLGWTILGWIVPLVWACSGDARVRRVEADGDRVGPHGLKLQGRDPRLDHPSGTP